MTTTYTLHMPANAEPGDPEALENAELIKDGFAWGAFVLGPFAFLWFFWNRLWLAAIGVLIAVAALTGLLQVLRLGGGTAAIAMWLLVLLIGLEANNLKRWTLRRRKPAVDMVTASDREEAEAKAFSRWLESPSRPRPVRAPAPLAGSFYRGPEPVIGLFPDMERPR